VTQGFFGDRQRLEFRKVLRHIIYDQAQVLLEFSAPGVNKRLFLNKLFLPKNTTDIRFYLNEITSFANNLNTILLAKKRKNKLNLASKLFLGRQLEI